jgi:hypothetical protein
MRAVVQVLFVVALVFEAGCARTDWIDRTLVTVDVTGTWEGTVGGVGGTGSSSGLFQFVLEQQGSGVKGFARGYSRGVGCQGTDVGPIEGTVAGDVFRFRDSRGCIEGELTVSGEEMVGQTSSWLGTRAFSLRRVDPSSRPASPPR